HAPIPRNGARLGCARRVGGFATTGSVVRAPTTTSARIAAATTTGGRKGRRTTGVQRTRRIPNDGTRARGQGRPRDRCLEGARPRGRPGARTRGRPRHHLRA